MVVTGAEYNGIQHIVAGQISDQVVNTYQSSNVARGAADLCVLLVILQHNIRYGHKILQAPKWIQFELSEKWPVLRVVIIKCAV